MVGFLDHALDAPVANLFILAGLLFLGIAVIGKITGKIEPNASGRVMAGVLGLALLVFGLRVHTSGDEMRRGTGAQSNTVESKNPTACGYSLDTPIYNKWMQLDGERGGFGCPMMNAAEASRSPQGTTGRWAEFHGADHKAMIFWHRNGAHADQAYGVYGAIGLLYTSMNRSASWLGFPTSDEYDMPGGPPGRRGDFEGGYIQWNPQTRNYQAYQQ